MFNLLRKYKGGFEMENKRIQEIINTLSKSGNIKDLTYWADLYRVSKRTIQNDWLEVSKLKLLTKLNYLKVIIKAILLKVQTKILSVLSKSIKGTSF